MVTKILVTGANGQLAQCIKELSANRSNESYVFLDSKTLDITNKNSVERLFASEKFDYCINCAAYTAVDKAEIEKSIANEVNVIGAKNLAVSCKQHNTVLIHISTDFVFDGESNKPYGEADQTNPISVYGQTKLKGENEIQSILKDYFIFRTSWLYSEYGNNFVKTMLKLSQEREVLTIINDQVGTPTYAKDLAMTIINVIENKNRNFGLYNYSNNGLASWYDFAQAIFEYKNIDIKVKAIPTSSYKTPATRPHFSVLDKNKTENTFNIDIPYWRNSLKECLNKIV